MQSTLNVIAFGKDDIDNKLSTLSGKQIDELAFGAIQLDSQGGSCATTKRKRRSPAARPAPSSAPTSSATSPPAPTRRASRACSTPACARMT
jgi:hypothetical protein